MYKQIEIDGEKWNYLIYDDGTIYSLKNKKFLSPDTSSGYARYILRNNKKEKRVTGHMMVGLYFIPNPKKLPIIHHIDGNRLNNNVKNLEWISFSENVKKENKKKYPKISISYTEEELKEEVWKEFRDGKYQVSSLGRLKNTINNQIYEGHINPILGYIRDKIYFKNGTSQVFARHRMIYEAFNPHEKIDIINHKNGIKYDNRISNLENVSQSENTKKAYTETKKRKTCKCYGINNITKKKIFFFSISDAAKYIGCNESNIRRAVLKNGNSHGYKWFKLTEEEYNLLEGSETIENIVKEKNFDE